MGVYSTIDITRAKATELLLEKICGELDDGVLESFMDTLLEPKLYNCRIVPNDWPNEDYFAG